MFQHRTPNSLDLLITDKGFTGVSTVSPAALAFMRRNREGSSQSPTSHCWAVHTHVVLEHTTVLTVLVFFPPHFSRVSSLA